MSKKWTLFNSVLLAALVLSITPAYVLAAPPPAPALQAPFDWSDWDYHIQLEIRNNATVPLPSGYTVSLILDTASLISQGQMQADCADLRISHNDGVTESELNRLVEGCNTSSTTVTFRTQAEIGVGGTGVDYRLYYGNAAATDPPEDPNNVYAFFDDFEDGDAAGWSGAKGTWSVVDDGGNYVYRYTNGGANWAVSYVNLPGVSDLEYVAKIRATDNPFTNWIGLAFRIQDENNFLTFYQSRDTAPSLFKFARIVSDNHTIPEQPVFTMPPDVWYWLRLQAIGNQVRARIWADGSAEPTGWNIERTESTFQSETNIGTTLYNHTTEADWDDVQVRRLVDSEPTVTLHSAPWWDIAWGYRIRLAVANNSGADTLPVGYSVGVTLDTSALIGAGQMLGNCDDLRIVSFDGASNTEIDRVVEGCGTDHTEVWFALQRAIGPGGEDENYYLYYGNLSAGTPPADGINVFIFYEDWEQGTGHWISAGGLDPGDTGTMGTSEISDEEWVSPIHSQKFPQKAAGGDAFSGYIPVTPSTGYAIGVWGKSAENTYAPVGFDPYDASYNQGSEVWLWTSEWTIGPEWSQRSGIFTTPANVAYVKIKSEWWSEGPGDEPVYMDNLVLRYALADEPTVTSGEEETILPLPVITDIEDTGPVEVGTPVGVTAVVSSTEGTIDTVILRVLSPETADIGMSLIAGDVFSGTWQGDFTPSEGGLYTYRILATSSVGRSKLSAAQTFTTTDTLSPEITLVSITDPIQVRNTQTLTVTVTDNGRVDQVTVEVEGSTHPMTQHGDQYGYSWRVMTVGTITYTVTATDTVGNSANLVGSFESLAREVDVCTWWDCKSGAASFSIDDGRTTCRAEMEAAGFRGTYYYNGSSTLDWFATYSAAGHEIGSHTVSHPCDTPCCFPNCTPEAIWECPYTEAEVNAYRQSQLEPNIAAIEAGTGMPVVSMAWPCGCADARRMTAASYYLLGARGYYDHIAQLYWVQDVNEATPTEFMNLNSANSYNQTFIDRAIAEGKWAIITSHGSCTGIDYIGSRSDVLWAAPVGEVLEYIYIRDAANFTDYSRFGRTISFDAAHNLGTFQRQQVDGRPMSTIAFDDPVTLKVHILDTDDVLGVEVDGTPVGYTVQTLEGTRYVLFDASLEVTRHVIITLAQPAPTIEQVSDNSPVEFGDAAHVTATVAIEEGTVETVTLRVLSPEAADYAMSLTTGTTDTYTASFIPGQIADYTYRVLASNDEGNTSQSPLRTLVVQDTTPPSWRAQSQAHDFILVSESNTLTAEGFDIGGLKWAVLATDESGVWQEFTWPVTNWWDHDWGYRRPITVTEAAGLARTAETVDLFISEDEFPGLTSCAAELRVADEDRNEVPVQVYDEEDGGILTCHLLFQASVDANASRTYYVYYGNPSATPPSYATDLTSSAAGDLLTVHNNFFDLDLDTDSGVVSRLRLLGGSNTNLPLSPESDYYWGWHQVCSSADGNITGKDSHCAGGGAPATGLAMATTLDGPIVKEFTLTSVKGAATYTMTFRFFVNAPYYQYTLTRAGTSASVMNNFWYANGNFTRLGIGSGGSPSTVYNTYSYGTDEVRIASFASVDYASIDGTNNDGTDLGGTDYQHPTASDLALYVATGVTQEATEGVLGRLAAPATLELGAVEDAPEGQYGSPMDVGGATAWTSTAFTWQNPAISDGTIVHWRTRYCDLSDNCGTTDVMSFTVFTTLADLSVTKVESFDPVAVGNALTYTLTVTNHGPSDATGVTLTDVLPTGMTLVSATPSQGTGCSGTSTITCNLGALANGATATVTIVVTPTVAGTIPNTASVTGNEFDPNMGNNTDTAVVNVINPAIELVKTADPTVVNDGDTVTYTITVENTGDSDLTDVTVDDHLPGCTLAGPTGDTHNTGVLDPDETWTYTCSITAGSEDIENTASVSATDEAGGTVSDTDTAFVDVINPYINVVKTADPTVVNDGDTVTYTITVENTGDSNLINVAVADHLPGCILSGPVGDTHNLGVLDPDETWTYTCSVTAGSQDIVNTATVTAADQAGGTLNDSDTITVTVIDPGIDIVKTADPAVVNAGDTVNFTITVENTSDSDLTNVSVEDHLPGCTLTGPTGDTHNAGVLDPDETWTYTCSITAGSEDIENTASVSATDEAGGTVSDTDTAFVDVINPYINVVKTADPTVVNDGDTVTYTITVENTGDSNLINVAVADHLPGCILSGPVGDTHNLGVLDPDETWTYTCSITASSEDIENTASVSATDEAGRTVSDSAHAEVDVIHPDIEITKEADQTVVSGSDVTFNITVENTGDVDLTDVRVTDRLAPDCARTIGDLAVGESERYTCIVEDVAAGFTNSATAEGIDPTGSTVSDTDTAEVTVISPAIQVVKETSVSAANVGEVITYTYTVENTGDVTLTNVSASDDRLGAISLGSATLAPGATTTGSATYLVGESDLPGPLINTVMVTGTPPVGDDVTDTDTATVYLGPAPAPAESKIYLPIITNNYAPPAPAPPAAPDLVVESIIATGSSVQVVVKNQGDGPVTDEFWVDVYINPDPVPTGVNQIWNDLCDEGLVWGITADALPLDPGDVIILTIGDAYYWPEYSNFSGSLPTGTQVYAQVDSASTETTYGAVLENHEITGGPYNNVSGPVYSTSGVGGVPAETEPPITSGHPPASSHNLPPRP